MLTDLRQAVRTLAKAPGFTAVVVLTLALGIGGNGAVFSLINGLLLKPPSGVSRPHDLVRVYTSDFSSGNLGTSSYPDYQALRTEVAAFQDVAAHGLRSVSVMTGDQGEMLAGELVTPSYFSTLGTVPALGRLIAEEDAPAAGGNTVAVISHRLWQTRFGGDPGVLGRGVRVNGREFTIVGVAGAGFTGILRPIVIDVWVPITVGPLLFPGSNDLTSMGSRGTMIIGRMRDGVPLPALQEQLSGFARRRFEQFPDQWVTVRGDGRSVTAVPEPASRIPPQVRGAALGFAAMLMAVVVLVLLIACANIANLMLARAARRSREIAVRLSLGASRGRLIRTLLSESLVLAVAGAGMGILVARWVADTILQLRPPVPVPIQLEAPLDWRVIALLVGLAALAAIAFGLLPALQASRPRLVPLLKGELAVGRSGRRLGPRGLLVVGQLAISLLLLIGAGLFVRSLARAQAVNPGFDASNVVVATVDLGSNGYDEARGAVFYRDLLERLRAVPGSRGVTLASAVPLADCCGRRGTRIEGYTAQDGESTEINWNVVAPDYFRTLRVPVRQGRALDERDHTAAPLAAMVNEAFARRYWPGQDPLGKRLSVTGPEGPYREVVGVTQDGKYRSLGEDPLPFLYLPLEQLYRSRVTLHVRATTDPSATLGAVRAAVRELDPNLPLVNPTVLSEALTVAVLPQRIASWLLAAFGGLGMALAVLGLYGLTAYGVAQRTREFGIRAALGAEPGRIAGMVVREGIVLAGLGLAAGVALAVAVTRLATRFLFGVSALDPLTFVTVGLALLGATAVASYLPARRATRVDPVEALRYE
ncbi:MAG TPA: ABC transporter permease [Gemmatimonadales bacterium]|nr:ABC transporter permease [Gemmatimonadales bacterium]